MADVRRLAIPEQFSSSAQEDLLDLDDRGPIFSSSVVQFKATGPATIDVDGRDRIA